jgi:hypothetical protein
MGVKLYVSHLPPSAEATLTSRFRKFGSVVPVTLGMPRKHS